MIFWSLGKNRAPLLVLKGTEKSLLHLPIRLGLLPLVQVQRIDGPLATLVHVNHIL